MLKSTIDVLDLGTLQYGKVYDFEFDIINSSPKDMSIDKIQASCNSCTKATMSKKVKGNETGKMKVTYTPGVTGTTSKWIDVVYDRDQVLRVHFKALVNE